MTLAIGKFRFNFEITTLVGLVFSTASITWALSARYDDLNNKISSLIAMEKQNHVKDSLQDIKLDSIYGWHNKRVPEVIAMRADIAVLMKKMGVLHTSIGYVSEHHDKNGHIIIEDVKNN